MLSVKVFDHKKNVYVHRICLEFFDNNYIVTASSITTLAHDMTMNENFSMIDQK